MATVSNRKKCENEMKDEKKKANKDVKTSVFPSRFEDFHFKIP